VAFWLRCIARPQINEDNQCQADQKSILDLIKLALSINSQMYKDKRVAVVVPCHNEETQIAGVINTMPALVDIIVVVDDTSTDNSVKVVESHPQFVGGRVCLIKHEMNQGVGGAIASGYRWCLKEGFDIAVVMAGDGQMNPHDLPALLDPIVENVADYTKGNRLVTGRAFDKIPRVRFFGNAALSLFTKIASGFWHVADSQTGYTAINSDALAAINWDVMYKRYGQPNDLLVRLNVEDMRVIDVPVEPVYNIGERSGIKIRTVIFTIGLLLVRLFCWRLKEKYIIRNFHPLVFFYAFGFCAFILSGVFAVRFALIFLLAGHAPEITLLSWLFSASIGFNAVGFAMWFDYEENRHLNPPMRHRDIVRITSHQEVTQADAVTGPE